MAQSNLIAFTEYTYPRYIGASCHRQIAEQLERVERGEIDRLMLHVPPRTGKSELASRRFPAYFLGRHPHKQFISASSSAALAEDFGRDVRNIIASPEYAEVFDTRLAEDSQAKGRWNTKEGGSYYAVGVGGAVMGRGAHIFLIDDPFGSMEDALSEVERKRVFDWYTGTVYNRLEERGAIVIINHRMHEDDLSGRLLAQQAAGGDQWTVVELKATPENPLWPEKFPAEALQRIKRNTQPRFWSALYEQNPIPDEGTYFQASWLRPYVQAPPRETMCVYLASDFAVTDGGGDYTVHMVVGLDPNDDLYVLDLWRKQADAATNVEALLELVRHWRPMVWATEGGQIKSALGPFIRKRMEERQTYVAMETLPSRHDKSIRAQSIRGRIAIKGLHVPSYADWMPALRGELLSFPAGKHDDQVDCLSFVGQLIDKMPPGRVPPDVQKPKVFSTDPSTCTVTLGDLFEDRERRERRTRNLRIY
jgi:predicted phage terminase large subunit-like protein